MQYSDGNLNLKFIYLALSYLAGLMDPSSMAACMVYVVCVRLKTTLTLTCMHMADWMSS
jgi:hypothetical protein